MENYMTCEKCAYFRLLLSNTNFGKCTFPKDPRIETFNIEAVLSGLGYNTDVPIVHKEDTHTCFVGIYDSL